MTDLLRWGSLSFPEPQSSWSRGRAAFAIVLTHRRIAALAAAALIGVGSAGYFAAGYARYQRLAAADATAMSRTASANADLQDALARMRDDLAAANQALSTAQDRVAALSDEARRQIASSEESAVSKGDRIAQLTRALEQAQRELHLAEAQHVTLLARLSKAETDVSEGQQRQHEAQAGLEQWQKKIEQLTGERDRAASERDQLRARVGQLEKQSLLRSRQPAAVAAAAAPAPVAAAPSPVAAAPAPVAAAPAPVAAAPVSVPPTAATTAAAPAAVAPTQVAEVAPPPRVAAPPPRAVPAVATNRGELVQFERVLASAGVDVEHLFADFGVARGLGGPFVPMPKEGLPENGFSAAKLAALPGIAKSLPLGSPMSNYRETSAFGQRSDPFNGRLAFHPGIDLAAPYNTPVFATAPGVVTYAGYRSDYGKVVEIDHGHGIVTRYSHLSRYVVLVGQRVAAGAHIGYEGSTGRSTGPHLLYEVDVNGEPQDPQKFMNLGRLVRIAYR